MQNFRKKANLSRFTFIENQRGNGDKENWKRRSNPSKNGKHSLRRNSIMYAGKRERNRLSPASTGTATRAAYTAVPAAALRCSIPVPNSTRVLAGLHSGNPLIRPISLRNRITAFTADRSHVLPVQRTSGTYVRGWSFTHRFALLHQLGRTQARSGNEEIRRLACYIR